MNKYRYGRVQEKKKEKGRVLEDWGKYMVIELANKFAQSEEFTLSFFLHLTSFLISLGLNFSCFLTKKKGGDEATDCYRTTV